MESNWLLGQTLSGRLRCWLRLAGRKIASSEAGHLAATVRQDERALPSSIKSRRRMAALVSRLSRIEQYAIDAFLSLFHSLVLSRSQGTQSPSQSRLYLRVVINSDRSCKLMLEKTRHIIWRGPHRRIVRTRGVLK